MAEFVEFSSIGETKSILIIEISDFHNRKKDDDIGYENVSL